MKRGTNLSRERHFAKFLTSSPFRINGYVFIFCDAPSNAIVYPFYKLASSKQRNSTFLACAHIFRIFFAIVRLALEYQILAGRQAYYVKALRNLTRIIHISFDGMNIYIVPLVRIDFGSHAPIGSASTSFILLKNIPGRRTFGSSAAYLFSVFKVFGCLFASEKNKLSCRIACLGKRCNNKKADNTLFETKSIQL